MLCLKKVYRDELLQLALILSLLRIYPESYFENDPYLNVGNLDLENGTSWRSSNILRSHYVHPKSLDSVLLNYEREVFADLNSLGRYNRLDSIQHQDVTAYLLNVDRSTDTPDPAPDTHQNETENATESSTHINESVVGPIEVNVELTQEDMDLIEVLWKQDVDLGFSLEVPSEKTENECLNSSQECPTTSVTIDVDNIEKLKTLEALNNNSLKSEPTNETDPWETHRLTQDYVIDTETGEYVVKKEEVDSFPDSVLSEEPSCELPLGDLDLPLPDFLEEALQLVGLDDDPIPQECVNAKEIENIESFPLASPPSTSTDSCPSGPSLLSKDIDSEEELDLFGEMIQTPQFHHPHHRTFQARMPFMRTMSMEQRWQDLANLLSLPGDTSSMPHHFSHHSLHNYTHSHTHGMSYGPDTTRSVLIHNATLTPPIGDINGTGPYSTISGTNLGSAVATSMNLTNSSEPMGEHSSSPHYTKLESSHDMLYYQNGTSEMNQTDGFLSSILNDEDLQLMDMAMNEGMYTMRMLDNNAISNLSVSGPRVDMDRVDTSSDSAVSSMGSERVPSLSDGEWCDAGSDSGHTTTGDHYVVDYPTSKYRPFDYSYHNRQHTGSLNGSDVTRLPPVAQKKHQMFGKRYFQEQGATALTHSSPTPIKYEYRETNNTPSFNAPGQTEGAVGSEVKYSCTMEFGRHHHLGRSPVEHIQHNHTYHLPAESSGAMQRPVSRDKIKKKAEEEHLTRDEKRARALNVPMSVDDIINLPMDEFNERLSKYDLSEPQLSLIRDIRRRGKNKVAAQNCRKRKLDQILSLADEVKDMRDRKLRLLSEHEFMVAEHQRCKDKFTQLYRHVFQNLRDADGNQYSPYQYSLQQSADGSIVVVPRGNSTSTTADSTDSSNLPHKE